MDKVYVRSYFFFILFLFLTVYSFFSCVLFNSVVLSTSTLYISIYRKFFLFHFAYYPCHRLLIRYYYYCYHYCIWWFFFPISFPHLFSVQIHCRFCSASVCVCFFCALCDSHSLTRFEPIVLVDGVAISCAIFVRTVYVYSIDISIHPYSSSPFFSLSPSTPRHFSLLLSFSSYSLCSSFLTCHHHCQLCTFLPISHTCASLAIIRGIHVRNKEYMCVHSFF